MLQAYNNSYLDFIPESLLLKPDPELLKKKEFKLIFITLLLKVLLLDILSLLLNFYLGSFPNNKSIPNSSVFTSKLRKLSINLLKIIIKPFQIKIIITKPFKNLNYTDTINRFSLESDTLSRLSNSSNNNFIKTDNNFVTTGNKKEKGRLPRIITNVINGKKGQDHLPLAIPFIG